VSSFTIDVVAYRHWADPFRARWTPSCLRGGASFVLIRAGHLALDEGDVRA
jgi:hypothetical protein